MDKNILLFLVFLIITVQVESNATLNLDKENGINIKKYYNNLNKNMIWIDDNMEIKNISFELINSIKSNYTLKPFINNVFEINKIEELFKNKNNLNPGDFFFLDRLLTKVYERYMNYLAKGFINWDHFLKQLSDIEQNNNIKGKWSKYELKKDFVFLLKNSLIKDDINYAINKVNYTFPYVKELEKHLKELKKIKDNNGYTKINTSKYQLKKGDIALEIRQLRKRLFESKDLNSLECTNIVKDCDLIFDNNLYNAILSFQKRHGLIQDGIVGKKTLKMLNMPVENKINIVRLNLERMRWLPRNLGEKFILVNIPAYKLKLYKKGKIELKMDVIVGEKTHPTPIFSHKLSQVILNPYWKIPQTIVKNELIPKLVKDSTYLQTNDIQVHENWDENSQKYDVSTIDWSIFLNNDLIGTPKEAPMRFIQTPGGSNPLGKIKFLFPNKYSVYLHDTPQKDYFKMREKSLSHGCIRLEKPFDLFNKIIKNKIESENTNSFKLKKKIPIHIVYLTSWVENNKLQFREDIYNYDKIHIKLLSENSF